VRILGCRVAGEFGEHRFAGVLAAAPGRSSATFRWSAASWSAPRGGRRSAPGCWRSSSTGGDYLDTGTPATYLAANLHAAASTGGNLIDPTASVTAPCSGR
jgi:hypothetical protein